MPSCCPTSGAGSSTLAIALRDAVRHQFFQPGSGHEHRFDLLAQALIAGAHAVQVSRVPVALQVERSAIQPFDLMPAFSCPHR